MGVALATRKNQTLHGVIETTERAALSAANFQRSNRCSQWITRRVSPFIFLSSLARHAGGIRGTANLQYLAVHQSPCGIEPVHLRTQANGGFLGIDPRHLWITSSSAGVHGARSQFTTALFSAGVIEPDAGLEMPKMNLCGKVSTRGWRRDSEHQRNIIHPLTVGMEGRWV